MSEYVKIKAYDWTAIELLKYLQNRQDPVRGFDAQTGEIIMDRKRAEQVIQDCAYDVDITQEEDVKPHGENNGK